jgi:biopolymer transport protein TolQ
MPDLAIANDPITLSPIVLFLQADIVVKLIMVGLLIASIWTWGIIVAHILKLRETKAAMAKFEKAYARAETSGELFRESKDDPSPTATLFVAVIGEWQRLSGKPSLNPDAARDRMAMMAEVARGEELSRLGKPLNLLATVGAVTPFVGLLGTVWGIMRSFTSIAAEQNTSLAVVAPGIAEALFATALGLFAAIPAVIAYNRFSHHLDEIDARLLRFATRLQVALLRDLDRAG